MEPGPLGPLLVLDDGVVALDGTSGEELWSYRHPYSDVSVQVIDGGATALVTRQPAADRFGDRRVTELDTATGGIRAKTSVLSHGPETEDIRISLLDGTSDLRLYAWTEPGERPRISARRSETSDEMWSFTLPENDGRVCAILGGWDTERNALLVENRLVVLHACADPPDRLGRGGGSLVAPIDPARSSVGGEPRTGRAVTPRRVTVATPVVSVGRRC
ncbi:PQQ-binding-like beta-propeller repeat protein [Nocardiopsis sp. FIRDI 009]|uniref:outer membrane protein assembly factor BamB family protein n=1 Tax=Nocardiopsis sp. FIRDI 009 TaxID=714197 RepID=UPI000E22A728|nr:PQQ-binding-like beta-propeller repeat protein [Nocardiopsis sp. FIRDI 009]